MVELSCLFSSVTRGNSHGCFGTHRCAPTLEYVSEQAVLGEEDGELREAARRFSWDKWWRHRGGSEDVGPKGWEGEGGRGRMWPRQLNSPCSLAQKKGCSTPHKHTHTHRLARTHRCTLPCGVCARVHLNFSVLLPCWHSSSTSSGFHVLMSLATRLCELSPLARPVFCH